MKKIYLCGIAVMLLGTIVLWAERSSGIEYELGEKLYNDKCNLCHGRQGDGNGPAAVAFSPKPANFTDPKFWQSIDDKKIADTIRKGHGMMPAFDLSPEQIKAITEYLNHFKK